ncbi:MAG: hypothetical protein D6737_00265 [Chloroflexi bacterium]|nr:MAG: hypothetical protein D6737_00265 [Chloroflexota bacterium]
MAEFELDFENGPILVDLTPTEKNTGLGYKETAKSDEKREEEQQHSNEAVNNAMQTIYRTAKRVSAMIEALGDDNPPSKIELAFELSLREDTSVTIVKSGGVSHLRVKLTWKPGDD